MLRLMPSPLRRSVHPARQRGISGTTALRLPICAVVPMIPSLRDGINSTHRGNLLPQSPAENLSDGGLRQAVTNLDLVGTLEFSEVRGAEARQLLGAEIRSRLRHHERLDRF